MNKHVAIAALFFAFTPLTQAQENAADKAPEVKTDPAPAGQSIGDGVRQAGREVKTAGKKARRVVSTLCADGRHTIKGAAGCNGHGGVSPQN
jgi:hypothetical protein